MYQPSACNMLRATPFCFARMGVEDAPRAHLMALLLHDLELGSCKEDQECGAVQINVRKPYTLSFSEQCQHLDGQAVAGTIQYAKLLRYGYGRYLGQHDQRGQHWLRRPVHTVEECPRMSLTLLNESPTELARAPRTLV